VIVVRPDQTPAAPKYSHHQTYCVPLLILITKYSAGTHQKGTVPQQAKRPKLFSEPRTKGYPKAAFKRTVARDLPSKKTVTEL
jgi:hypothetical protein